MLGRKLTKSRELFSLGSRPSFSWKSAPLFHLTITVGASPELWLLPDPSQRFSGREQPRAFGKLITRRGESAFFVQRVLLESFPNYCTVTLTVVECEIVPDCAVTVIEAVPRFGCVPLPYPLQPPITNASTIIAPAAATVSTEVRSIRRLLTRHAAMLNRTKAARREHGPSNVGTRNP